MEAVIPKTNEAVVPPGLVEKVTPAVNPGPNAVANVTLEYPERFKQIVQDVGTVDNPESRVRLAQAVVQQDKDNEVYRPNQKTQWDKVLVNVLSRNYNEALKWFNGGGVKEEEARDLNNNLYYKEVNELGATGRIRNREGKLLSNNEIKALDSQGGVFTANDEKSLKTLPWVNGKYNAELANKALTSPVQLAMNDAFNAARTAGSANQNIDEQLKLTSGLKDVLNHISALPEKRRQALFGYVSRLNQIGTSAGTTGENRLSANLGGQQTVGTTAGLSAGGAGGAGEGVPPTTGKIGGALGASGSGTVQSGVSGGAVSGATSSQNTTLQEQQTLQAAIMQELQGVIRPEQFQSFMRLQALNAANDLSYQNIPAHVKPPTWRDVATTDPFSGGADAMLANRIDQQRNNALMAAWSKELYKSQREMAKTGKVMDIDKLADDFQKSDVFKAINNTYQYKLRSNLEGRHIMPPKGELIVNNRNEIKMSPGE